MSSSYSFLKYAERRIFRILWQLRFLGNEFCQEVSISKTRRGDNSCCNIAHSERNLILRTLSSVDSIVVAVGFTEKTASATGHGELRLDSEHCRLKQTRCDFDSMAAVPSRVFGCRSFCQ